MWSLLLVGVIVPISCDAVGLVRHHAESSVDSNPLLADTVIPAYGKVKVEHVRPAVQGRLDEAKARLAELEASLHSSSGYDQLLPPLEELYELYNKPWAMFSHIQSVRNSPEMRKAEEELRPAIVDFGLRLSQSKAIFQALASLNASAAFADMPEAHQRAVSQELLDRRESGVALKGASAEEFNKLQKDLSELSNSYGEHVLDAKAAWNLTLHSKDQVKGIPKRALEAAAEAAKRAGYNDSTTENGPWLIGLDGPMVGPALMYGQDRSVREIILRADSTVASNGTNSNAEIVKKMLKLRQRKAELLEFHDYAALSLANKMARHEDAVNKLLDDIKAVARPAAQKDDDELQQFAASGAEVDGEKLPPLDHMEKWDIGFYAQRLQKARYGVDQEALRVYFPYAAAIHGVQGLTGRLFGISLELLENEEANAGKWHQDVNFYMVSRDGKTIGYLAVDPYSRPGQKKDGGWMMQLVTRRQLPDGHLVLPVAAVMTNFPRPQGGKPSLLSLGEVKTLFHEFGHAMQHLLTQQTESSVSGTNGIEWDAVEIVSQFMEFWVDYDRETLFSMARHYETNKTLPEESYQKLLRAQNFRKGTNILAQVFLATVDLRLHEGFKEERDPDAVAKDVGKEILIHPSLPESRMLCSFSHIFNGAYGAGYYSYLWSEVLSADAFGAFDSVGNLTGSNMGPVPTLTEDNSLPPVERLGRRWSQTLLGQGGGRDPDKVFQDFRGRKPSAKALLHYSGLDLKVA
mmetsp:Transcript_98357/g.175127  ORF Transcript_98357/g.175127 Transcript_98357/m.175127 type:complete len:746 (+) Transcript_98357:90-2327(+)|eukprot:CAMPEP_0197627496 /NCGR_PEP_ID=MMETSP1338-20131121/6095_1 /TAXON_ID=43686 ORGANISM="Pelagodinium beii, Strain RCC1491" /NCGR_SAMPLE_ID=MMETSP1338 /ASSEMBLY_ACC=CAM_ASM_000754 /LENGTH=745 /DNA_ID=CAMNT_0043198233 /DNA_START=22 /DNA_END=2259 /DNA_ORIENTATION=+